MSFYKNTSVYLLANILNSSIPFFLLPVLTRVLPPDEYGQIAMFQVLLTSVTMFIGLNAIGAINRKYYDDNLGNNTLREFNGSCLQILFISTLIPLVLTYFLSKQLSYFFSIPTNWIYISIIISALTFLMNLRLGQWQIRGSSIRFGILQVSFSLINMILSVIFIVFWHHGANGRVNAQLISAVIVGLLSIILLYQDKLIHFFIWRPEQIKEILSFGIPLIPHSLGFFLITSIDRFIINKELGLTSAGVYMVAAQLSMILAIFYDAVNKAYMPWLFEKLKLNDHKNNISLVKYTYFYFLFTICLSLVAFIIGPSLVTFIAGDNYTEAGGLIGWLCLGQSFGGMYLMVANYIFYSKNNNKLAIVTIFCGIFNFSVLYILITHVGLIGAGIGYATSRFLQFLLTWRLATKCIKMPWDIILNKNHIVR
ncbi:oligosaccharide flippase family protein [Providencia rettgeri]|nr:oligosaccharide flippase family protein [Providencia rettgeri]QPE17508.1 oligosaccharide flippase family protein [Providencia rettgeri]